MRYERSTGTKVSIWVAAVVALLGVLTLLVLLLGPTPSAWSAGCSSAQSQTKHQESPIGINMTDQKLVTHWCYAHGRVTDVDQQIKYRFVNCADDCFGWQVRDRNAGHYRASADGSRYVVYGQIQFCQQPIRIGTCFNGDVFKFDGWVKAGGATSFPSGFSGGGGGGSW